MVPQWILKSITRTLTRALLRITYPILDLILHFTLFVIISIWSVTQYPIKTSSILGGFDNELYNPSYRRRTDGRKQA